MAPMLNIKIRSDKPASLPPAELYLACEDGDISLQITDPENNDWWNVAYFADNGKLVMCSGIPDHMKKHGLDLDENGCVRVVE